MFDLNKYPVFARILLAGSIVSAWLLPTVFMWASLTNDVYPMWLNICWIVFACLMYGVAFVLTFVIGGLRYVLTGDEFADN